MTSPAQDGPARILTPMGQPDLFVPRSFGLLRLRRRVTTVTLPNGERAKVTVDDSGTVTHIERAEGIDAIVRPKTVRLQLREAPKMRRKIQRAL